MIKLTIKAANGLVDDFQVEAPSEWTVLELKRYLFRHYPNQPVSWSLLATYLATLCQL